MNKNSFTRAIAILLTVSFVAPAAFFVAPHKASASAVSCIGGLLGLGGGVGAGAAAAAAGLSVPVVDSLDIAANSSTAGSTYGSCINDVILIPLARMAIRAMLQQMTASVISWINGGNGTGKPSYVLNMSAHLQGVGDAVALPFINQVAAGFNSPFGAAISSALRGNYMQNTNLAGFFSANRCTLAAASPDVGAYLAGNWSKGGIGAWFALTTQSQNNPFTLYQAAQNQLGANVGQAQDNRRQDLVQSSGFLSWCGSSDAASASAAAASTAYQSCAAACPTSDNPVGCVSRCDLVSGQGATGVNPGDSCFSKDGTPGTVQTPGSVIHDYTQKAVVNSGFEQLISATDLDNALGAIVSALLNKVLGSVGGLLGTSQNSSSGGRPFISQLQNFSSSNTNVTDSATQTAQSMLDRVAAYIAAWQTILTAANDAQANVTSLINTCTTNIAAVNNQTQMGTNTTTVSPTFISSATAQISQAQTALATEVAPLIKEAQAAMSSASTTQALAQRLQTAGPSSPTFTADMNALIGMPPSLTDLSNAQRQSVTASGATAVPAGSLTVSGSTLVSQMALISTNAATLQSTVCNPKWTPPSTTNPNF